MDHLIDHNKCLSRRCVSKGNFTQCSNNPKYGEIFCGKHINTKYRIDEPLPEKIMKKYKKKSNLLITIKKKKTPKKILKYEDILNPSNKIYVKDIRYTLNNMKLDSKGYYREIYLRLKNFFEKLDFFKKNPEIIKKLQNNIRNNISYKNNKYKGIAYYDKSLCNNTEDFYSLDSIETIPDEYFFSYVDKDKFVYCFDIRSLKMLLESPPPYLNPYNRKDIPKKALTNFNKRIQQIKNEGIYQLEYIDDTVYTSKQKMTFRVMEVFQKIDECDVVAGGANIEWFLKLPLSFLKIFYKELEDIWNYRAELSQDAKERIVPGRDIFKKSVNNIYYIGNLETIRYYILSQIEKLVSCGITLEDKKVGALWVLTALVIVSKDCAEALPWLIYV